MFEHLGYFKEYIIGLTPMGIIHCDKDRDTMGWNGRRNETAETDIILDNKKVIKKGTEVTTILYPFCGKRTNR